MTRTTRRARAVRPPAGPVVLFPGSNGADAMDPKGPHAHPITQVIRPDLPVRGGEPPRGFVRNGIG